MLRTLSALPKRFTLKQFKQTYPETTFKLLLELLHQGIIILSDEQGMAPRPKVVKGWGVSSSFLSDSSKLDHAREMLKRSRGAIRVFEQIVSVHDARLKSRDRDADSPLLPVALISLAERYGVGIAVIKKLRDLGVFEEQEVLLDIQQHRQIQEPLVEDALSSSLKVQYPDAPIVLAHIEASSLSQRVPYALISEAMRLVAKSCCSAQLRRLCTNLNLSSSLTIPSTRSFLFTQTSHHTNVTTHGTKHFKVLRAFMWAYARRYGCRFGL